jgi:hypothetical protein
MLFPRVLAPLAVAALSASCAASSRVRRANATVDPNTPRVLRFERPLHAGARFHIETGVTRTSRTVISIEGQSPRVEEEHLGARFEADATVLAVNAAGLSHRVRYTVRVFEAERNGALVSTMPEGSTVELTRAAEASAAQITVNGATAEPTVREGLAMVLTLAEGQPGTDEVFGGSTLRRPGDEWNAADRPAARRYAEAIGLGDAFEAVARFVGYTRVREVPCSEVDLTFRGPIAREIPLPAAFTTRSSRIESHARMRLPLDETAPVAQGLLELRTEVDARGTIEGRLANFEARRNAVVNSVVLPVATR